MQSEVEKEFENKDRLTILVTKLKFYLYERNYKLTSRARINYLYVAVLNTIFFIQFYFLISLPVYNEAVAEGSDMYYLVEKGILVLGKNNVGTELNTNDITVNVLCGIQLMVILIYFLPVNGYELNMFISKYIIHVLSTIPYIPSVYISTQNLLNSKSIYVSLITLLLTLLNRLMFITMHFEFSIRRINVNELIRIPFSISSQLVTFFLLILFLLCKSFLYPMSLIIYLVINILYCLFEVKQYCIGFSYFHESITKLMGILKIMKISIFLCYFIVIATEITLVKNNIITFIGAFFVFFAHFFLTFKKYSTKSIVIDSENQDQTKMIIFIIWYFNCFKNRAEKKNQLYLSSLLKNHTSECQDPTCFCQKRTEIYDPSSNAFGSPKSQPHQDLVYIKHFFLKILTDTHKSFPKSNEVLFILAFYNLEILHFIPQTIELIKQLKKKSMKKNLTLSEDYVLYCLGQRCYEKIREINNVKGNLNLQRVRLFDLKISSLKEAIKFSVNTFESLWRTICSQRYNQKNLVEICKVALEVMFKIEDSYKEIKTINSVSTQLKELMIFYSKVVAHDIHLQSEIRKQIKLDSEKAILSNVTEIKEINIFSPNTITLVTSQISNIRWASKNCYQIFGYNSRQEFIKLKINDLMPKFFSQNHDSFIQKWLHTGHSSKLNKCSYLWGSTKDGYCFSMGVYVKIIPLQKQQDFAFFAAIQKIDIHNEIICSQDGQILGCGKFFSSTIKCSQKALQQYKMNIQVLLPSTNQIFIDAYFPGKKLANQLSMETRYQGYFPKNLQGLIKDFSKEKEVFINKYHQHSNLNELYSNFLKQKMQEITVHMGGQYISLTCTCHELTVLSSQKKKTIVLKLLGIKKNNIEKYYNQLQKMISRIEQLIKQSRNQRHSKGGSKSLNSLKKDFFKAFLNPKRVRKILQQQSEDREGNDSNFNRMFPITEKEKEEQTEKSMNREGQVKQKIIYFRKKLALGARHEIKGQRAKYNIWRIKKALLAQGVFSRYTYDLLTGNANNFGSINQFADSTENIEETFMPDNRFDNQAQSQDQLMSDDFTKREKAQNDDKIANDKETFNSATSSAVIITMTNSIKMFKMKLRSLNTPKLLYWLNIGLILLVLLISGFEVWLWVQETKETKIGQIFFTKGIESSWAIDSMLMGKLMTQKLVHLQKFSSSFNSLEYQNIQDALQKYKNNYINRMQTILSTEVLDYADLKSIDPSLLSYLFLPIPLNETLRSQVISLQALDFMMRELDYSKLGYNIINPKEVQSLLQMHKSIYQSNLYYKKLQNIDQILYLTGLIAFILAFTVTIPIVHKIQSKVQEIMYLISKISQNQRRRYFLKFTILTEQLKKMNQHQKWTQLQALQQSRMNNSDIKIGSIVQNYSNSSKISKTQQKGAKMKFYETIFFKIVLIYLIYLLICCSKFIYIKIIFDQYIDQNNVYAQIMSEKLKFTQNSLLFNQFVNQNQSISFNKTELVNKIYNSYHLSDKSISDYDSFLINVTTGNICTIISDAAISIEDSQFFLKFFRFSSNSELSVCENLLNGSLTKGLFGTIDYIEQTRSYLINQSLDIRENFLKSSRSIEIEQSLYYANTMCYILQRQVQFEAGKKKKELIFSMSLWLVMIGVVLFLFTVAWIFIYLNIAERASYINAFLLLIPYDVLSQNPYIKLYIKNQFDYKTSVS